MLVLSRKHRESVVIGALDSFHRVLEVLVLGTRGTNVKLGFDVDADVPVHRAEVWEPIQAGQPLDERPEKSGNRSQAAKVVFRSAKGDKWGRTPINQPRARERLQNPLTRGGDQ